MPTLNDIAAEIDAQPSTLSSVVTAKLGRARLGSLMVGAGDSYAAALCAQYLSNGRVTALNPHVLIASPALANGRDVYFITSSGRTRANVAAAQTVRRRAAKTVAITSVLTSPIAGATADTIGLPYAYVPRMPGTLSFTLSLLVAVTLACGAPSCNFEDAFEASRKSTTPGFSRNGCTYFLGNGPGHAVALYSSLKVFEVMGSRSVAELVEEFGHAALFSLRRSDVVNVLDSFDPSRVGSRLATALRRQGYESRLLRCGGRNSLESVFHAVFRMQRGILREARSRGIGHPYITRARDKLALSDSMIY